jgi:threonine/homoserine/homoserine lactone efflux protein
MPDAPTFAPFVAAALVMLLVPGPSVLYIRRGQRVVSGGVLIALGAAAAVSGKD